MTIIAQESFDLVSTSDDLVNKGWYAAEGTLASTSNQWGGAAWNLLSNAGNVINRTLEPPTAMAYYTIAYHIEFDTLPTSGVLLGFLGANLSSSTPPTYNSNVNLTHAGGGSITIYTGGIVRTTLDNIIVGGGAMHVEVRCYFANVGILEIWINGVLVWSDNAIDTLYSSGAYNGVAITGGGDSGNTYLDDVVIQGSNVSMPPLLGVHRIETLVAESAGTNSAWIGTFADVDDSFGINDGDTSFASSATIDAEQDYNFADLTGTPDSITSVTVVNESRKSDAGVKTIKPYVISNAVQSFGTETGLAETYVVSSDSYTLNPDGNIAWTPASVNALQAGIKIIT